MKKTILIIGLLFLMLSCGGGGGSDPAPAPQAKFEMVSFTAQTTSYNRPSLLITEKNTGNATGYNLAVHAYAHNAAGTIIDTAVAFPANLGNIAPGESAQDEAVFFNLNSHTDYAGLTFDASWLSR